MPDGITTTMTATAAHFQANLGRFDARFRVLGAKATEAQARDLHRVIVRTSPVDTGRLQRSWPLPTARGSDLVWGTGTTLAYARTLEYGGYTRVGPRTIELAGGDLGYGFVAEVGIYSTQAPLGFVRRALAQAAVPYHRRLQQALRLAWTATAGESTEALTTIIGNIP